MKLMLDTNVLVAVCTPGRHQDAKEWFRRLLLAASPPELLVSVVADYELRRSASLHGATRSLEHFEEMAKAVRFVPLSAEATRRAASLSSSAKLSDADAIIAAQAIEEGAVLVTTDSVFRGVEGLEARHWNEIDSDRLVDVDPRRGTDEPK
jgi:predicted nucleic acid-binding protein